MILGFETNDDAAVYRMNDDTAALLTVDFFTPIVDDPYDFGRITAANALSDIYAMGGRPLTAMNLLAFPSSLGPEVVGEVLRGGAEKVSEAGALIVGGHTIDDSEPKYGLSVMGTVHPDKVLYNRGARPDDVLVLTKPLGTGIWGTALKRERYEDSHPSARAAIEVMATLNKDAIEALDLPCVLKSSQVKESDVTDEVSGVTPVSEAGMSDDTEMRAFVRACTDITGFGLAGHLHEMMLASSTSAVIQLDKLPLLEEVWELCASGIKPGKTAELIAWAKDFSSFDGAVGRGAVTDEEVAVWQGIVCDPQTSGGLLLSMSKDAAESYIQAYPQAVIIGTVCAIGDNSPGTIVFA